MTRAPSVERLQLDRVSPVDTARFNELVLRVWPPSTRRSHLPEYASAPAPAPEHPWPPCAYVVRDAAGLLIASATVRPRRLRTASGELTVLTLASVLSDPEHRGEGLGRAVVQAAFALVDDGGFPCAFFQTSIPDFYRKLAARIVTNPIVNSLGHQPGHTPFWDPWAIVYPARFEFPPGPIDTLGPGW